MFKCTGMDAIAVSTPPSICSYVQDNSDDQLKDFESQRCSIDRNSDICYELTIVGQTLVY